MNIPLVLMAAPVLAQHPGAAEYLTYPVVGIAVVIVALALLWGLREAAGIAFRPAKSSRVKAAGGQEATRGNADDGAVTAAIVAAVHVALGDQARIVSVTPVDEASRTAWAVEGRRQHFQSHKIR